MLAAPFFRRCRGAEVTIPWYQQTSGVGIPRPSATSPLERPKIADLTSLATDPDYYHAEHLVTTPLSTAPLAHNTTLSAYLVILAARVSSPPPKLLADMRRAAAARSDGAALRIYDEIDRIARLPENREFGQRNLVAARTYINRHTEKRATGTVETALVGLSRTVGVALAAAECRRGEQFFVCGEDLDIEGNEPLSAWDERHYLDRPQVQPGGPGGWHRANYPPDGKAAAALKALRAHLGVPEPHLDPHAFQVELWLAHKMIVLSSAAILWAFVDLVMRLMGWVSPRTPDSVMRLRYYSPGSGWEP